MQGKCLNDHAGQRTSLLVLDAGDEPMACPQTLAAAERLIPPHASGLALIAPGGRNVSIGAHIWAIAVQHTGLDSRHPNVALLSTIAFPAT